MFILTYSSPTTGEVTELFATREAADAEAADVRHAMEAVGYGAYSGDLVRVRDTADMPDEEIWDLPEDVQARIVAAEWEENDRRIAARGLTSCVGCGERVSVTPYRGRYDVGTIDAHGCIGDGSHPVNAVTE